MAYEKGSRPEGGFKRRGPARRRKKSAYSVENWETEKSVNVQMGGEPCNRI